MIFNPVIQSSGEVKYLPCQTGSGAQELIVIGATQEDLNTRSWILFAGYHTENGELNISFSPTVGHVLSISKNGSSESCFFTVINSNNNIATVSTVLSEIISINPGQYADEAYIVTNSGAWASSWYTLALF